jgi:hypothetical protein
LSSSLASHQQLVVWCSKWQYSLFHHHHHLLLVLETTEANQKQRQAKVATWQVPNSERRKKRHNTCTTVTHEKTSTLRAIRPGSTWLFEPFALEALVAWRRSPLTTRPHDPLALRPSTAFELEIWRIMGPKRGPMIRTTFDRYGFQRREVGEGGGRRERHICSPSFRASAEGGLRMARAYLAWLLLACLLRLDGFAAEPCTGTCVVKAGAGDAARAHSL